MKSTTTKTDKKRNLQEGNGNSELVTPERQEGCRNVFVDEVKEIYFTEKSLSISIPNNN